MVLSENNLNYAESLGGVAGGEVLIANSEEIIERIAAETEVSFLNDIPDDALHEIGASGAEFIQSWGPIAGIALAVGYTLKYYKDAAFNSDKKRKKK